MTPEQEMQVIQDTAATAKAVEMIVTQNSKLFDKMDVHETRIQKIEDTQNNSGCKAKHTLEDKVEAEIKSVRDDITTLKITNAGRIGAAQGKQSAPDITINNNAGDGVAEVIKKDLWSIGIGFLKKELKTIIAAMAAGGLSAWVTHLLHGIKHF